MARMRIPIVDSDLVSRKRIPFGPEIINALPCSWTQRGWTHRRHIISQHFLRGAWNAMAPQILDWGMQWLREVGHRVSPARLPPPAHAICENYRMRIYASEILRSMNDNKKNLFVEDGGENSGSGSFAHDMEDLLKRLSHDDWSTQQSTQHFIHVRHVVAEEVERKSGSWGHAAKEHYKSIKEPALVLIRGADSYEALVTAVEDLAFSTDFDLDKTEFARLSTETMWVFRNRFLAFAERRATSLVAFGQLIVDFCS